MIKRNNNSGIARQGDVIIVPAALLGAKLPENMKKTHKTLAFGEVTGHSHQVLGDTAECFADDEGALPDYIKAAEQTMFGHDEHEALPIKKGDNFSFRQSEFVDGEIRNVKD